MTSQIDNLLEDFIDIVVGYTDYDGNHLYDHQYTEKLDKHAKNCNRCKVVDKAKSALYELILEVINTEQAEFTLATEDYWAGRRSLKAEQRKALDELFNKEESE